MKAPSALLLLPRGDDVFLISQRCCENALKAFEAAEWRSDERCGFEPPRTLNTRAVCGMKQIGLGAEEMPNKRSAPPRATCRVSSAEVLLFLEHEKGKSRVCSDLWLCRSFRARLCNLRSRLSRSIFLRRF